MRPGFFSDNKSEQETENQEGQIYLTISVLERVAPWDSVPVRPFFYCIVVSDLFALLANHTIFTHSSENIYIYTYIAQCRENSRFL